VSWEYLMLALGVPMIATRFVAGSTWLVLSATALGNSAMACDSRNIMSVSKSAGVCTGS
jgi:hypothetical protein